MAEPGMMCAASQNPRCRANFQVRPGNPDRAGHRQLGQWMFGSDRIDFVDDHAKAIAHVNYGGVYRRSRLRVEDKSYRIGLAAYAERMNFHRWSIGRDRGANFEHVSAENLAAIAKVVGVVLHEGSSAFESGAHNFHGPNQRGGLPVALRAKAVSIRHQTLRSNARKLGESMEVLKGIGECFEISLFEEMSQAQLNARGFAKGGAFFAAGAKRISNGIGFFVNGNQLIDF